MEIGTDIENIESENSGKVDLLRLISSTLKLFFLPRSFILSTTPLIIR